MLMNKTTVKIKTPKRYNQKDLGETIWKRLIMKLLLLI
jgi:hypothetical protein